MSDFHYSRRLFLSTSAAGLVAPAFSFAQSRDVEGGIGGTGIVGILAEFGSLIIAGRRVQTDTATQYRDVFGQIRRQDLRLNDNLTIEADGPANALVARRVSVTNPIVGRVTEIAQNGRLIVVNGTRIALARSARVPRSGDQVVVSGLWRGNDVVSANTQPPRSDADVVAGTINRRGGRVMIGAVPIEGRGRNLMQSGGYAAAIGRFDPTRGVLVAQRVQTNRFAGATVPLRNLAIEGYLEPIREAPGYRVSGLGHSFERNLRLAEFEGSRVLFAGAYDGLFQPDSAIILPEDAAGRVRMFRALIARGE